MSYDLTKVLADYAQAQPRRASGGLYALAGFNYQLRLYVAQLAEALAAGGNDLEAAGQVFMEALSDLARRENDKLICIQVKRTLTRATLKDAATEFTAIESFLKQQYPNERCQFKYELVASHGTEDLSWDGLPANIPERITADELLSQGRLERPRIEPEPGWRAVVAVWNHLNDPYGFVRFALDRAMGRTLTPEDAQRVRDDICERYAQSRSSAVVMGQLLQPQDFDATGTLSNHLEIGKEITLARMRDRQYMPREKRRDVLYAVLEERHELSRRDLQSAARVFWLNGRSGVGKSVLLLQVVERLVRNGRRVLWLGGAAEKLEPAMRALAAQPEELRPEFIAIDDLYDRDARTRLDLASLGAFIDEAGPHPWPMILSCGPTEFADDFAENSRYRGFELHREIIYPVAGDESRYLVGWYEQRTGRKPAMDIASAPAFRQAQDENSGLFVSLAVELEHGELKEFARRFTERIEVNGLDQALRLPLALNRLYLRAPYSWLSESDREKLATLNREGDFSLLDPGEAGKVVRLTHPHLGDVLYLALRKPGNPTAYANDLRDAFCRSLQEGDVALTVQLLRIFSAHQAGLAMERLKNVDETLLAESCAKAWKETESRIVLDVEAMADIAVSWACWMTAQPVIASVLGNDLVSRSIACLDSAVKVWSFCWQRLWEYSSAQAALREWAAVHLPEPVRMNHPAWSFVWEMAQQGDAERARWQGMGLAWLEKYTRRPDWHFVWKHLLPEKATGNWLDFPAFVSGERRLEAGGDGPDWAYVLEDLLKHAGGFPEVQQRLLAQGWQWLRGREDRAEWSYVWQALLKHSNQLPQGVTLEGLLEPGWQWLAGREDWTEWSHVWQALLKHSNQLPQGVTLEGLLEPGWQWLAGREDRAEWSHVWQALLKHSNQLPQGVTLDDLLASGWEWLQGREDRAEWSHVWEALYRHPDSANGLWSKQRLAEMAWNWLALHRDAKVWPVIWWDVVHESSQTVERRQALMKIGVDWLGNKDNLAAPEASRFVEGLLDMGCRDTSFLPLASRCLYGIREEKTWTIIAAKYIEAVPFAPDVSEMATEIAARIRACPNRNVLHKTTPIMNRLTSIGDAMPHAIADMLKAFAERASAPAWEKARKLMQSREVVRGIVVGVKPELYSVELDVGLMGIVSRQNGFLANDGDVLDLIVQKVQPEKGRVVLCPASALSHMIRVGDECVGYVSGLKDYGVFVRIGDQTGLLHRSLLPVDFYVRYPLGSNIRVRVLEVTPKGLSLALAMGGLN